MRRFLALSAVLYALIAAEPVSAAHSGPQLAPVNLAAVLSLTGNYASIGQQEQTALRISLQAANQTGGIDGHPITLTVEDDHSVTEDAAAATASLLANSRPAAIIGGSFAGTCNAMRPITERAGVVQYCLSGAPTDDGTFFSSFPDPGRSFGDLPAAFMRRVGYSSLAIIASDDRAGRLYTKAILGAASGQGLKVVGTARYTTTATIDASLDRLLAHKPRILYIGATSSSAATVLLALQRRKSQIPIWLVSADATRSAAKNLADLLPDAQVYSSTTKLALFDRLPASDPQRPLLAQFSYNFSAATNGRTPDIFAVIAADSAEFLVAALRADRGVGGRELVRTLERTPRTPALYSWYHFGPHHHNGTELPGVVVRFLPTGVLDYVFTLEDSQVPQFARPDFQRANQ